MIFLNVGAPPITVNEVGYSTSEIDSSLSSGPAPVDKDPDPAFDYTVLESGAVTVGNQVVDALQKQGGRMYTDATVVELDGEDISDEVVSNISFAERAEDLYTRFNLRLKGETFHYLDRSALEANKAFRIYRVLYGNQGGRFEIPIFTGISRSGGTQVGYLRQESVLEVDSNAKLWDNAEVEMTLSLEANPYNVVVGNVPDECEVVALSPASYRKVRVLGGQVLIDRSGIGNFGRPPYGTMGYHYTSGGGGQNLFGGWVPANNQTSKQIVTVTINEFVLDLIDAGVDLTIDGVGTISIFVANDGSVQAVNGAPPANAVPLAQFVHRVPVVEGQALSNFEPISDRRLIDTRLITVPEAQRTRSGVATFVLERAGFDVTTLSFPQENDDEVRNNVKIPRRKVLEWLRQWIRPSRWRAYFDPSGTLRIVSDEILPSSIGPAWTFHEGNAISLDWSGPEKGNTAASVTVRGVQVVNNGLVQREEYTESRSYSEEPPPDRSGGNTVAMGGNYQRMGAAQDADLRLTAVVQETRTLIGRSLVRSVRKEFRRKNQLNLRNALVPPGQTINGRTYPQTNPNFNEYNFAGPYHSGETPFSYMYENREMELDGIITEQNIHEGRLKTGSEITVERYMNPHVQRSNAIGGGRWNYGADYGFKNLEDNLEIMSVTQEKFQIGPAGFLEESEQKEFQRYDPHWLVEGGDIVKETLGNGGVAATSTGHWTEEDHMMLVRKNLTKWTKLDTDPKYIKIERIQEAFRKKSGSRANDGNVRGVGDFSLGHSQSVCSGKEVQFEIVEGSPPSAESLQDDIERWEVFATIEHPVAEGQYGDELEIDEQVPYVETTDMATRVAHEIMGRSLASQLTLQCSLNPQVLRFSTVLVDYTSPEGRRYRVRGRTIGERYVLGLKPQDPDGMFLIIEIDYQAMRPLLATRT